MNKKSIILLALFGIFASQGCHAKRFKTRKAAYLCDKVAFLQNQYEQSSASYRRNKFQPDSEMITQQMHRFRPKERRKLYHARLNKVQNTFLSFPPGQKKDAALNNLEKRIALLKAIR